jgi:hypothetical protein
MAMKRILDRVLIDHYLKGMNGLIIEHFRAHSNKAGIC